MVPCVGLAGGVICGVSFNSTPALVEEVADRLLAVTLFDAVIVFAIRLLVDVMLADLNVALTFTLPAATDTKPDKLVANDRVTVPFGLLATIFVSPATMLVTPVFTKVTVPDTVELDKPEPVVILALVKAVASVNTFTKLF